MYGSTLLGLGLLNLVPAPAGTEFVYQGHTLVTVGQVGIPFDPGIPRRVIVPGGVGVRDLGWVWRRTFVECRAPVLNVAEDRDRGLWLVPPAAVWAGNK